MLSSLLLMQAHSQNIPARTLMHTLISYVKNAVLHVVKKHSQACVHAIPEWNEIVADKHALTRQVYYNWCLHDRPNYGLMFQLMPRTHAEFKQALRLFKKNEAQFKADKCKFDLNFNDPKSIWKNVHYISSNKVIKSVLSAYQLMELHGITT